MATVFAQNVVEIAVRMLSGQKNTVNVWHMHNREGTNAPDVAAVEDFRNNWQDHVMPQMHSQVTLTDFVWRSLDPDDSNVGVVQPDPAKPVQGQRATTAMPPQVCWLVHKNTDNRPRGRRDGLSYLPGVTEADVDGNGLVVAAVKTAWDDALLAFWNGVTDDPAISSVDRELCVLETTPESRLPGTQPVTIGSRKVTSLTLDSVVATQRDRLR